MREKKDKEEKNYFLMLFSLTQLISLLSFKYWAIPLAASKATLTCASLLLAPKWGVHTTLSNPINGNSSMVAGSLE